MRLTITLPDRETVLEKNRQRWAEVLADPQWAGHLYRIETDAFGRIVMTPPAAGSHNHRGGNIAFELRRRLGGTAMQECPISTADGVRAADVGWYSTERYNTVRGQLAFETAAEICVEVLSPRNTELEMQHRRALYFDAGAIECWICDLDGRMTHFHRNHPEDPMPTSNLCPDFPDTIND